MRTRNKLFKAEIIFRSTYTQIWNPRKRILLLKKKIRLSLLSEVQFRNLIKNIKNTENYVS